MYLRNSLTNLAPVATEINVKTMGERVINSLFVFTGLEDGVNKWGDHRALCEHDKCSHQSNRDDQWCKPVFFADFQEVPDIFDQIKKGFHGSENAVEIDFKRLSFFSIALISVMLLPSKWIMPK